MLIDTQMDLIIISVVLLKYWTKQTALHVGCSTNRLTRELQNYLKAA